MEAGVKGKERKGREEGRNKAGCLTSTAQNPPLLTEASLI